ncbi:hypothetical protein KQI38_07340 [Tissierella carlieri]|uniref:Uncharacterized protein n=1 Tax=Tissierella carlieri TaxID=689904 RepID=A0ABT1SHC7_9FIRM|nr:hypothetical protein [Tissierella carlieri]MBU5311839.1 hypothetical protein [Tissierella carlieri]MCQ4925337.1 hypothetical protein [Tissierella carlieri]MDU5082118.1 hypothetical protein [Bacillota bacterium]
MSRLSIITRNQAQQTIYLIKNENPNPDAFKEVRGRKGWKEASFDQNLGLLLPVDWEMQES